MGVISIILAVISALIAIWGIAQYVITNYHDKDYWAKEEKVWGKSSRVDKSLDVTKPPIWLKQHNDGPNPCDDQYPNFPLRDFSTGVTSIGRKESV